MFHVHTVKLLTLSLSDWSFSSLKISHNIAAPEKLSLAGPAPGSRSWLLYVWHSAQVQVGGVGD